MAQLTKESVSRHVQSECEALNKSHGLPFRELLTEDRIVAALDRAEVEFRDRIYTPMVTLWAFLSQSVASTASSCENAVSRVLADRVARRQSACSTDTNSFCQARARLPEQVLVELTQETGQTLHQQAPEEWSWKGRRVRIVDGSTATMADTPENQKEYPQSRGQKPGLGFPILRMVVLLSLSVGTVLDCAVAPCRGKCTGEQSLFRQLWDTLEPGEIVLADRLFDAYRDIALLRQRGIDSLFGKKQSRSVDFRRGRRLGSDDHIVTWKRPPYDKTRFESRAEWESLPEEMEIREVRVTVRRKGYKTRSVVIVTTLLDAIVYSSRELTDLFAERWHCELDLRSIKRTLGMHHLRCKTPEMVRKELWAHLLAYNLIRARMAQAAAVSGALPRRLSFTAAKSHIHNFTVHLQTAATNQEYQRLETELLKAIAQCKVGDRPGRKEPRALKKRVQKYSYLTKPRNEARKGLAA
jgi:Transposase DDE domain